MRRVVAFGFALGVIVALTAFAQNAVPIQSQNQQTTATTTTTQAQAGGGGAGASDLGQGGETASPGYGEG
jgi:hypothetical protein